MSHAALAMWLSSQATLQLFFAFVVAVTVSLIWCFRKGTLATILAWSLIILAIILTLATVVMYSFAIYHNTIALHA